MHGSSAADKLLVAFAYFFVTSFAVFALLPFFLVLINSFSDNSELIRDGYRLLPRTLSFRAYEVVFASSKILRSYEVTVFVSVVGTVLSILVTSGMAYSLSLRKLRYENAMSFYVYFTMLFSGGLVPWYILISRYLHLRNSVFVMIIPFLVNPFYMFLLKNFFRTIPSSLMDSARIDGANELLILARLVLPLSLPAIATIVLFYFLDFWNQWYAALFFIEDSRKYPLQYLIMQLIRSSQVSGMIGMQGTGAYANPPSQTIKLATAIIAIGPIVFAYPFVQKYFIRGLILGGVKG